MPLTLPSSHIVSRPLPPPVNPVLQSSFTSPRHASHYSQTTFTQPSNLFKFQSFLPSCSCFRKKCVGFCYVFLFVFFFLQSTF